MFAFLHKCKFLLVICKFVYCHFDLEKMLGLLGCTVKLDSIHHYFPRENNHTLISYLIFEVIYQEKQKLFQHDSSSYQSKTVPILLHHPHSQVFIAI